MAGSVKARACAPRRAGLLLVLLTVTLLTGCAGFVPELRWPDELPARSYFVRQWQEDSANQQYQDREEYLLWVTRFYQGYNMVPGWLEMKEQVSGRIPAARQDAVREQLMTLGARIGSEWAKNNKVRVINTRCVAVWRDALIESLAQDDLFNYLDRVEEDVEALLAGRLDAEQVRFERYYEDDFEF